MGLSQELRRVERKLFFLPNTIIEESTNNCKDVKCWSAWTTTIFPRLNQNPHAINTHSCPHVIFFHMLALGDSRWLTAHVRDLISLTPAAPRTWQELAVPWIPGSIRNVSYVHGGRTLNLKEKIVHLKLQWLLAPKLSLPYFEE